MIKDSGRPYSIVTVRLPPELRAELESIAVAKGETLSVIVRDLVRQAAVDARRVDPLGVSPVNAKNFR
jgi:predicted transcriptional regulator